MQRLAKLFLLTYLEGKVASLGDVIVMVEFDPVTCKRDMEDEIIRTQEEDITTLREDKENTISVAMEEESDMKGEVGSVKKSSV